MSTPFPEQITERGPRALTKTTQAIEKVLRDAQEQWPCRTQYDTRARTRLLVGWIREMLNDLHWSLPRVLASLGYRLYCHQEQIPWEPNSGESWSRPSTCRADYIPTLTTEPLTVPLEIPDGE